MITYNKLRKNITTQLSEIHNKTYTVIGVTLAVVLILVVFAIRPVVFSLSDEMSQLSDLQNADQQIKDNLSNLAQDINSYDQNVAGNDQLLSLAMPKTAETGVLFANLNAIAESAKVQIGSVQFLKPVDVATQSQGQSFALANNVVIPHTNKLFFVLNGSGNFSDVENFIAQIEGFPRIINVTEVNLEDDTTLKGNTGATYTIKGFVYYLQ